MAGRGMQWFALGRLEVYVLWVGPISGPLVGRFLRVKKSLCSSYLCALKKAYVIHILVLLGGVCTVFLLKT